MQRASYRVGNGPESTTTESVGKKKPDNTAFKQQRLPAWQPILTPKSVFPTFIIISLIFIPVGVVLLVASNGVIEVFRDYTDCPSNRSDGLKCSELRMNVSFSAEPCYCLVNITVPQVMEGEVYVYYGLTNFYQNHRRYVKSRDDNQLVGETVTTKNISGDCVPYNIRTVNGIEYPIAPCGAIANSFFNDSFTFTNSSLVVNQTDIAWHTDHTEKFNNPYPADDLTVAFQDYVRPYFWSKNVSELDPDNIYNNGYKNEAFEVWMRTAAFPTFRKLYGRLGTNLHPGEYQVLISYNYPVVTFNGTKRIILSTTSFLGGKNSFLGIAYITVGCLSFVVALGLLIVHFVTKKRKRSE